MTPLVALPRAPSAVTGNRVAIDRYVLAGFDIIKLKGPRPPEFRLRIRDWRVRFRVNLVTRTLDVLRIRHRSEAYR